MKLYRFVLLVFCILPTSFLQSQIIIDEVIAVVGEEMIKESEVRNQYMQLSAQQKRTTTQCSLFEDLLFQKLIVNQAKIDSIQVTNEEIDAEIERRVQLFTGQEDGLAKLEAFYGKNELEIKTSWRPQVREQILAQRMRNSIVGQVEVTPNEVRSFYLQVLSDSLPRIPTQYEYAQIHISPQVSEQQDLEIRQRLEEIRQRIIQGASFDKMAVLYSDDAESAKMGGELGGYMSRGELVPEFSAVAFRLKEGEVSRIVKTDFGYHIIQMVELKGERAKLKHILMRPRITPVAMQNARKTADSLYTLITKDSLSFARAAQLHSSDKRTKQNGGRIMNPYTGSSKLEAQEIDPMILHTIRSMNPNDVSEPFVSYDQTGRQVFVIITLLAVIPEHEANLTQDYDFIKMLATEYKRNQLLDAWIEKNIKTTYISIPAERYHSCDFKYSGWIK